MNSQAYSKKLPYPEILQAQQQELSARRQASVYDAVAGRVNAHGFILDDPLSHTKQSSSEIPAPPESVLFRRKNAPTRFEENDVYFAHESLPPDALPDSDLLKALHGYASEFYSRAMTDAGKGDWKSMDETALLALGILMDEMCHETLGQTGDLVFTEAGDGDGTAGFSAVDNRPSSRGVIRVLDAAVKSGKSRSGKRRKVKSTTP